jgi:hypothetical protein
MGSAAIPPCGFLGKQVPGWATGAKSDADRGKHFLFKKKIPLNGGFCQSRLVRPLRTPFSREFFEFLPSPPRPVTAKCKKCLKKIKKFLDRGLSPRLKHVLSFINLLSQEKNERWIPQLGRHACVA